MRTIDQYTFIHDACKRIKAVAERGIWRGDVSTEYFENCKWHLLGPPCIIIFTKETGYHSSGWWKNPDYERCYHLSISFPGGKDKATLKKVLANLFQNFEHLLWIEPPYSAEGKANDVWHYRLFCDINWAPIKPRGEVYSTQFTELGWKSFSELHYNK